MQCYPTWIVRTDAGLQTLAKARTRRRPDDGFGIGVKTPTLHNVGLRKRLFHSGHVTSVTQAMRLHYNNPSTPPVFRFNPLLNSVAPGPGLKSEFDQVVDFLDNALTDPRVAATAHSSAIASTAPATDGCTSPQR